MYNVHVHTVCHALKLVWGGSAYWVCRCTHSSCNAWQYMYYMYMCVHCTLDLHTHVRVLHVTILNFTFYCNGLVLLHVAWVILLAGLSQQWVLKVLHWRDLCPLPVLSLSLPCLLLLSLQLCSALLCSGLFLFSLPLSGLLFFLKMITPHALFILFGMSSSSLCSCTWGVLCVY